jgi:hypothetical protein
MSPKVVEEEKEAQSQVDTKKTLTIQAVKEQYNLIKEAESPIKVQKTPKFTAMNLNSASGDSPAKFVDRSVSKEVPIEAAIKETDESSPELQQSHPSDNAVIALVSSVAKVVENQQKTGEFGVWSTNSD